MINFEDIINKPLESYEIFYDRLKKEGQMAPFPEFKETIDFLLSNLENEYVKGIVSKHPAMLYELNEVKTFLLHLNLKFNIDDDIAYPYEIPFTDPYPYRPSIDAIENAIRFMDKINRLDPDNKAVKLYHFDRYCYHRHALVTNEDLIIIPTTRELSMGDFIKTRGVPIEFVGVISKTLRVDGHHQSPLDFWYHDFNHARRLYAYIKKRLKEIGAITEPQKMEYYSKVNLFIFNIIVKNFLKDRDELNEIDKALLSLCEMIIFEIVHETAVTLEKETLIADLLRGNGPQPFEYMHDGTKLDEDSMRTPVGNIESGASKNNATITTQVRYFLDASSIGLLANVYRKLNHFYYDREEDTDEEFIKAEYRTPEFIIKAVRLIFEVIDCKEEISDEMLHKLITDTEGTKEKILNKGINANEAVTIATEPLKGDEIIELIASKKKMVYTLFGYSALGYEDENKLLEFCTVELAKLDKEKYIICIGATEEGIGKCYKVAKDLGFETIGVVSTQALSYSGKFSDFVDMIYIVNDDNWGGFVPLTNKLAETTKVFLSISDTVSAYGGGSNTAVTLAEADKLGIKTKFTEMDMSHVEANKRKIVSYKGEAYKYYINKDKAN